MVLGIIFGTMALAIYLVSFITRRIVSYGSQYCTMVDDLRQIIKDADEADKRDDSINKQFYLKTDNISVPEYKPSDKKSYYIALEFAISNIENLYEVYIEKYSFAYRCEDWDIVEKKKKEFIDIVNKVRSAELYDGCVVNIN